MHTDRRRFVTALLGSAALPALRVPAHAGALSIGVSEAGAVSAAKLAHDPKRPQYHLLPAANWMNDPNGPIYWNGQYHMFYQYNPHAAVWGDMHWGHAVSPDMVRWTHLPVALAPTPDGPDAQGCFTGTAVVQDGQVVILYTGVKESTLDEATIKDATPPLRETQCLAVAEDPELRTWKKAGAPVIDAPPPQMQVNGFRDPSPWRQGEWWYTVLATGIANRGGAVLLYRSRDLRAWEFMHILSQRDACGCAELASFDPWEVWECPEFFALDDWHVLMYSTGGKVHWQSGKLDAQTMTFAPVQAGLMDYGSFYAAKTQLDKAGNRILWGWITESRPEAEFKAAGWAGMMSLPRVLTVAEDGRVRFSVADAVKQLRGARQALDVHAGEASRQRALDALRIHDCCGEMLCKVHRTDAGFTLALRGDAEKAAPWMTLEYDPQHRGQLLVDGRPLELKLDEEQALELHLYIDGSVIELLVNGQVGMTKRFYPAGELAQSARLQWTGSTQPIAELTVWQLTPISPDRLTASLQ